MLQSLLRSLVSVHLNACQYWHFFHANLPSFCFDNDGGKKLLKNEDSHLWKHFDCNNRTNIPRVTTNIWLKLECLSSHGKKKKEAVVLLCGNIFITLAVTTTLYSETVLSQFCAWRLNQLLLLSSNTGKIWKGDRTRIPETLYGGVPEQRWIIAMESLFRPEFSAGELINQATTSLSLSQAHCVYKSLKNSHFYRYE